MLYDPFGKPIEDRKSKRPVTGITLFSGDADRLESDASRDLTPEKVDAVMRAANRGDVTEQCRLAAELEEKNWDIAHAVQTRRNAVRGVEFSIEPADKSARAKRIAEEFEEALSDAGDSDELDTFEDLIADLMSSLIPGFAASETVWGANHELLGFKFVEPRHFTYRGAPRIPRLLVDGEPDGIEIPYGKMVFHNHRVRSGDPARGGLIRPLAWMHCFSRINWADLLRFIERHAMPFVVAKVDEQSWKKERGTLKNLIRSFGPDGGGVFTKATELELLQAANNTGDVYFKLLEYVGMAVTKIVLGQTATAGDGGGWSKDDAQSQVRQDILEADCDAVAATVKARLAAPWTLFNHGQDAPVPFMKFHYEPPEDLKKTAEVVKTLYEGGLETDETEMSEKFGMKLTRRKDMAEKSPETAPVAPSGGNTGKEADASALSSDTPSNPPSKSLLALASQAILALSAEDVDGDEISELARNAVREFRDNGGAEAWLGELQAVIDEAVEEPDGRTASRKIMALTAEDPELLDKLNDGPLAELLEKTIFAAAATGKAEKVGALKTNEGGK